MPKYFSTVEPQIELYLEYLHELKSVCQDKLINFELSDRIIYELDRDFNKNKKINY